MIDTPHYTITSELLDLVAQIAEALGQRASRLAQAPLALRRANRIRTLHGSLAIEGNSLSEGEIQTLLEGHSVIAPPREIQEVRNAIKVYDAFRNWDPSSRDDLLRAHEMMMAGLLDAPGHSRRAGVGIMSPEGSVIHVAPPAGRVDETGAGRWPGGDDPTGCPPGQESERSTDQNLTL